MEVVERDDLAEYMQAKPQKRRLLLIPAMLDDETAARLEDARVGYLDPTGRWWLPGVRRTPRSRALRPRRGKRGLRGASLRLGQLLADYPDESWTERHLAERGGTTQVTAHRLLVRLEEMGLVGRRGQGRAASRWVEDVMALRRWLAREGRPVRGLRLSCFVRDPEQLPDAVAGHQLVLTGAAAAEKLGMPVRTALGPALVRVEATGEELEAVPEALGGFRTDSGPNLVLLADPDRLASTDARRLDDESLVAPSSRVMLDLYLEPRGAALADVFLGIWGSR